MAFVIEPSELKAAKGAHESFMIHLGALLLLGPMAIFPGIGRIAIALPLLFSTVFILYTRFRISRAHSWFVEMHWRFALQNYRWLFLGYAMTTLLLLVSWLVESTSSSGSPDQLLAVALVRIGVMPVIVAVFVCFVVGNGALNLVLRHEVPERLVKSYPPPATLEQTE